MAKIGIAGRGGAGSLFDDCDETVDEVGEFLRGCDDLERERAEERRAAEILSGKG